jgi:hypothetical protein
VRTGTNFQKHALNQDEGERPADVPSNVDPQTYVDPMGDHYQVFHTAYGGPAVDARGRADCQTGQTGYTDGPLTRSGSKYPPASLADPQNPASFQNWENSSGGGSHVAQDTDLPGLRGPTYVTSRLGIDSVQKVP